MRPLQEKLVCLPRRSKPERGRASEYLKGDDDVARRFTRALTAEHRVNDALFEEARQTFKERGVLDLIIWRGCYDLVSSLLNAFDIPKPT